MAKVLELQLKRQSIQWIFRIDFLKDWLLWSLCTLRVSQESSPALQVKRINSLALSLFYGPTLTSIHDYWKNHSFDFVSKVLSLLFNTLSRFVIAFLPRSKYLLISWPWSPSAVILESKKIKHVTVSTLPPSICHEVMGTRLRGLRKSDLDLIQKTP